MKVQVDGKDVFELTPIQCKVIKNDIPEEDFQSDMERRVRYIIEHKYERCFDRLKKEWEPVLAKKIDMVPTNKEALAELIFALPEYKDRSSRERENLVK